MSTHTYFISAILLIIPAVCFPQNNSTSRPTDELSLSVIRAIDYAELTRQVIRNMCINNPQLAVRVSACHKIDAVPDHVIEAMALPYFNSYVSPKTAKAALAFWSSPDGKKINKKLIDDVASGSANTYRYTQRELDLLNHFNKSEAGIEMSRLANDRSVSQAIIRQIGAYAP
jgi:hypothetical protein